ncbi:acetylxylan esterase [Parabacteroides sp. AF17-28]|uniref:alpha/beta hydrolase family protein n=1 Tax=Parabacteroides sp. AF17-28 TaxID=2292241 RepID=UPI000EFDB564|nr:acetylxylan esterase [Parabacteroides sp. AF17-28]RHR58259.1 acetylxylan esterase [Parabacteroides sp. AF17-28]
MKNNIYIQLLLSVLIALGSVLGVRGQETHTDESLVPSYILPDPLKDDSGKNVVSVNEWENKRRPEIVSLFEKNVYGKSPEKPEKMTFTIVQEDSTAFQGRATRKEVLIGFPDFPDLSMLLLIYLPNQVNHSAPVFLGLNFQGNQAISQDSLITISPGVDREVAEKIASGELSRGKLANRWPIELLLENGYGIATIYRGDIDPDFDDGFKNGVHVITDGARKGKRLGDAWGTIAAWAWGLSRGMDYLVTDSKIDKDKIAVVGHSRLGKAALWAGATDPRFAIVISNNSGCGGAALSRRRFGETVWKINDSFPHWFCSNFHAYDHNEDALPVDQHELISLIAPRPVYVASAKEDLWADPKGEFLSAMHAEPVYALYGLKGLTVSEMPEVNRPLHKGYIGYHIRPGRHGITPYDWSQYIRFCDIFFRGK